MSIFKGRGVVLNAQNAGESDRRVTLLLKEHGKVSVSARGARKPKSKFLAGTQLFTYSDFVLFDGGSFYALTQVDVIESFYDVRDDYEAFVVAAYFAELYDKYVMEGVPCDDLLLLLLVSLQALQKNIANVRLVLCVFQMKFLQINGYSPEEELFFEGEHCNAELSGGALKAAWYVLNSPVKQTYSFAVSDSVLIELCAAADGLMKKHFELDLKSAKLLDVL